MSLDITLVNHGPHVVVSQDLNLLDFVRSAETVKEMKERHPGFQSSRLGNQSEVHHLLGIPGAEHGKASCTRGVNVGMVAENRKRLRRDGTRGHVEYSGE
jgi:hypothetical protein